MHLTSREDSQKTSKKTTTTWVGNKFFAIPTQNLSQKPDLKASKQHFIQRASEIRKEKFFLKKTL